MKPERLQTIEQLAKDLGVPRWLLVAAKVKHKWAKGRQIARAAFEAALQATREHSAYIIEAAKDAAIEKAKELN